MMSARLCAAMAIAAMTLAAGPETRAADLYGEGYYPPPDAEPYGDRYGQKQYYDDDYDRPDGRYADRGDRYDDYTYRGSLKDGYAAPLPPPSRYTERYGYDGRCASRWQIRSNLRAKGWIDLRPLHRRSEETLLRARRVDSGRVFMLTLDRCTGEVVDARPHYLRAFGAYAPRRWARDYRY